MIYVLPVFILWIIFPFIKDLLGYSQQKLNVYNAYVGMRLLKKYGSSKGEVLNEEG